MNKIVAIVGGLTGVGLGIYACVIVGKTETAAYEAAKIATAEARQRSAEEIAELNKLDEIAQKVAEIAAKEKTEVNSILGDTWADADMTDSGTKLMYESQKAQVEKYVRRHRSDEDAELIEENNRLLKLKRTIEARESKIVSDAMDKDSALVKVLRDEGITPWCLYGFGGAITSATGYILFCMWRKIIKIAKAL